jgi:hypothetical protein
MKKRWYIRAIRTFFQAFVSSFVMTLSTTSVTNLTEFKGFLFSVLVSTIAAVLSAIMNYMDEIGDNENGCNSK